MCFCVFACAFATGVARGDGTVLEDGNWLVAGPVVLPETDNYTRKYFQSVFNALPKQWSHDTAAGTAIPTKWGSMQWQSVKPDGEKPDMARLSVIDHALYFASRCWVSPKAQEAELRLGSDDAVCVWLNGERVYTYPYKRGYVPEGVVVPVKLRSGTNTAVLALINADETRSVGARMYPCSAPLDNEVFIRADNTLQTGEYARIGAYWLPAAGPTNRPSLVPCTNALAVERCTVTGPSGGIVTNILIETGTPFPQGVKISLKGKLGSGTDY